MKKILVFGYFGYITNQLDGQTVKTRAIYDLLNERAGAQVRYADTQAFRSSPLAILRFIRDLFWCTTLVWLPCSNNLKFFIRPLSLLSKLLGYSIIYVVVGGWLHDKLKSMPACEKRIGKFRAILAEDQMTCRNLQETYGFKNVEVIPNFRYAKPINKRRVNRDGLRLVFMARVDKRKGLDVMEKLCEDTSLNFSIDIYGPINQADEDYFKSIIGKYSQLKYKGVLQPENIASALPDYDAMILPTHFFTEGLPGSIVDAYFAGLPILVTRWKHAEEFVVDGKSGIIVDFENPLPGFTDAIKMLEKDIDMNNTMKQYANQESLKYTSDRAWSVFSKYLS